MTVFAVRQHDQGVAITKTIEDDLGPVNLTGATVRFHMKPSPESGLTTPVVSSAAAVVDAVNGKVTYTWLSGDTAVAGVFDAEWEVTFAGGAVQTFPVDGLDTVLIRADLA